MTIQSMKKKETSQDRLMQMLSTALGPQIGCLLDDPGIIELMLNPDGRLWIDRLGVGQSDSGYIVRSENAQRVIELVASSTDTVCNANNPRLSAELPGSGSRFQGMLPPITSAPVFTIRRKAILVFTLDDYVRQGIMTEKQKDHIVSAVKDELNILIVGGTGSGKTTFGNAVLAEIAKTGDRIVIIEDTSELQCTAPNSVYLRSRDHVTMTDLLRDTMRLRPDRIVVGEVRGKEALDLLDAWNTGHPGGLCTIHANSAHAALKRLEGLILRVSNDPQREFIAEAVNIIVYMEKYGKGRRIKEIVAVDGLVDNKYVFKPL